MEAPDGPLQFAGRKSDEVKTVSFETYDGLAMEVFIWGQDDCEGDLPHEPPAQ